MLKKQRGKDQSSNGEEAQQGTVLMTNAKRTTRARGTASRKTVNMIANTAKKGTKALFEDPQTQARFDKELGIVAPVLEEMALDGASTRASYDAKDDTVRFRFSDLDGLELFMETVFNYASGTSPMRSRANEPWTCGVEVLHGTEKRAGYELNKVKLYPWVTFPAKDIPEVVGCMQRQRAAEEILFSPATASTPSNGGRKPAEETSCN